MNIKGRYRPGRSRRFLLGTCLAFLTIALFSTLCYAKTGSGREEANGNRDTDAKYRHTYYLAEGYTGGGFDQYICIQNYHEQEIEVKIIYMLSEGGNLEIEYTIPSTSRETIFVNDEIGPDHEVSSVVRSEKPVVVERPIYFWWGGMPAITGGHDVLASPFLSEWFYFAEGCTNFQTDRYFNTYLCFLNPNEEEANVEIAYLFPDEPPISQRIVIEPERRNTICVEDYVGYQKEVSSVINSDLPILVERPMYFHYNDLFQGGSDVVGALRLANTHYFAEGCTWEGSIDDAYSTFLCLCNPNNETANVVVTYMYESGETKLVPHLVPGYRRHTVDVNKEAGDDHYGVSMKVDSSVPIVAERPMYFCKDGRYMGGHDVVGLEKPEQNFYFAEGCTRNGFVEYLCLMNPGDVAATVAIDYMTGTGEDLYQETTVNPHSRATIEVNEAVGVGKDVSCRVDSDIPIIAERPMYFIYGMERGLNRSGGHIVMGDTR